METQRENWWLAAPLYLVTAILAAAGGVAAYWVVHEYFGYHGNKSVVFYIGGMFAGGSIASPLWWIYRKRYPKAQ